MQAIASTSINKNSVRSHVVKYKKGEQIYNPQQLNIVQVTTADYRLLHKAFNTGNSPELFATFNDTKPTHNVDVKGLLIHTLDCDMVDEDHIKVSIIDINTTGLNLCENCMS